MTIGGNTIRCWSALVIAGTVFIAGLSEADAKPRPKYSNRTSNFNMKPPPTESRLLTSYADKLLDPAKLNDFLTKVGSKRLAELRYHLIKIETAGVVDSESERVIREIAQAWEDWSFTEHPVPLELQTMGGGIVPNPNRTDRNDYSVKRGDAELATRFFINIAMGEALTREQAFFAKRKLIFNERSLIDSLEALAETMVPVLNSADKVRNPNGSKDRWGNYERIPLLDFLTIQASKNPILSQGVLSGNPSENEKQRIQNVMRELNQLIQQKMVRPWSDKEQRQADVEFVDAFRDLLRTKESRPVSPPGQFAADLYNLAIKFDKAVGERTPVPYGQISREVQQFLYELDVYRETLRKNTESINFREEFISQIGGMLRTVYSGTPTNGTSESVAQQNYEEVASTLQAVLQFEQVMKVTQSYMSRLKVHYSHEITDIGSDAVNKITSGSPSRPPAITVKDLPEGLNSNARELALNFRTYAEL